jgi:hypothetical protein
MVQDNGYLDRGRVVSAEKEKLEPNLNIFSL